MISGQSDEDIGQGESTGAAGHGSSTAQVSGNTGVRTQDTHSQSTTFN